MEVTDRRTREGERVRERGRARRSRRSGENDDPSSPTLCAPLSSRVRATDAGVSGRVLGFQEPPCCASPSAIRHALSPGFSSPQQTRRWFVIDLRARSCRTPSTRSSSTRARAHERKCARAAHERESRLRPCICPVVRVGCFFELGLSSREIQNERKTTSRPRSLDRANGISRHRDLRRFLNKHEPRRPGAVHLRTERRAGPKKALGVIIAKFNINPPTPCQ